MAILLVGISGYFINDYWWLLMVIPNYIMTIGGYCIISYCWLFYVIL
jgi:hypothetical protein